MATKPTPRPNFKMIVNLFSKETAETTTKAQFVHVGTPGEDPGGAVKHHSLAIMTQEGYFVLKTDEDGLRLIRDRINEALGS